MNNRLIDHLSQKKDHLLTVYFTAGYPELDHTKTIIETLDECGVDIIEIGMPYSDPLADGETIQQSGAVALSNGMHLSLLFEQLKQVSTQKPLVMMGYVNQFLQYGPEKFCKDAQLVGISGFIFPDMPLDVYQTQYASLMHDHQIVPIFLITPKTPLDRIQKINNLSKAFIYAVSSSSTTGGNIGDNPESIAYFKQLQQLNLNVPIQIGFGISDKSGYDLACQYANGAIIGSAFIKSLNPSNLVESIQQFIKTIR